MITLDGSQGEGGGQILRTALGLSLVTGQPFGLEHIRARRKRPGLMRQHVAAVHAAARIGGARVQGAEVGSSALSFAPGGVRPGSYEFSIGTAGSTTLVLQAVLPALLRGDRPSRITLCGGTHNPMAPPFDFIDRAFLPLVRRLGPQVTAVLARPGFFPAGGGRWSVDVTPTPSLRPFELLDRGDIRARRATALVANLDPRIGKRELAVVRRRLGWSPAECVLREVPESAGPGNVLLLEIEAEHVTEVFAGFGERGRPAEEVAEGVVREARAWMDAGIPVGPHLADQLLVPMAFAGAGRFRTLPLTLHALTNIAVIGLFLPVQFGVTPLPGGAVEVAGVSEGR